MKFVKETFVLIGLAVFGMSGAASANEAVITLDIEASVTEPGAAAPVKPFSVTVKTPAGEPARIVHRYQEGRRFSLAVTPSRMEDGMVRMAFILTDILPDGETKLAEGAMASPMGETATFVNNSFDNGRTWRFTLTPRR